MNQRTEQRSPGGSIQVPFDDCYITPEAHRAAARVLASGQLGPGTECEGFERDLARLVGARHAVSVSSCTAALELALRSLRLDRDSPVLVSTMAAYGTVHAILRAGLRPVLVDVDPATGAPNEETTRLAAAAAGRPAAMVVVHWAGAPADVAPLAAAAGLSTDRVVEDASHALGARRDGLAVGSGATVCFSFDVSNNLPVGQGGMVTTTDGERAEWLRRARRQGMTSAGSRRERVGSVRRYDVEEPGLDAELNDLHAAIGRSQLTHVTRWQHRRRQIAARYDAALAPAPGLALPHRPNGSSARHAWRLYPVRLLPDAGIGREQLLATLGAAGVGTSEHLVPVHRLTYFRTTCAIPSAGLPGSDALADELVCLPMHPRLTDQQVDHVCAAVRATVALFGGARPQRAAR